MGESIKAVCSLILIVAPLVGIGAWMQDQPGAIAWSFRIGSIIAPVLALGTILKLHFRADVAFDYLRKQAGTYFNRDGFCFALSAVAEDHIAYVVAHFQNQRDRPCRGRIALRPARGFFLGRANLDVIVFDIECAPAAFGMARLAVPLPENLQGKRQAFEVGASVDHLDEKGQTLRFHDGVFLRTNSNFGNPFGTAVAVAGLLGGAVVINQPAKATIQLPIGVAESLEGSEMPEIVTLWKLGDPPLSAHANDHVNPPGGMELPNMRP